MVYCGKPSAGCVRCRRKRLKVVTCSSIQPSRLTKTQSGYQCDQKRPNCSQCINATEKCAGYRNQVDLMFRDESTSVRRKFAPHPLFAESDGKSDTEAAGKDAVKALLLDKHRVLESTDRNQSSRRTSPSSIADSPPPAMTCDLHEAALNFFMTNYVPGSHFDCLPMLYSTIDGDNLLHTVLRAVSLASLSHGTRRPELMPLARQQYSQALSQTNIALQDPSDCVQDATLAAVLLLAHFETLTTQDHTDPSYDQIRYDSSRSPAESWNRHVQGAVSLLALRPSSLDDSPIKLHLHRHVNAIARYSCIQQCIRLPRTLSRNFKPLRFPHGPSGLGQRFVDVLDDFTEFRAAMAEGSLTDTSEVMRQAKSMDAEIAELARTPDLAFAYEVVPVPPVARTKAVYRNQYHIYPSHHAALMWNELRMIRMALNRIIVTCCDEIAPLSTTPTQSQAVGLESQRQKSVRVVQRLCIEICQSSTQFLQQSSLATSSTTSSDAQTTSWQPSSTHYTIASAYFLTWPLYTAGSMLLAPASVTSFVIERLHFIAREKWIPQAERAARMLEGGVLNEDWLHMLHLF
jgi:hypothetical protein